MKITKSYLKQIIKEEMQKLSEAEERQYTRDDVLDLLDKTKDNILINRFRDNKQITDKKFLVKVGNNTNSIIVLSANTREPVFSINNPKHVQKILSPQ